MSILFEWENVSFSNIEMHCSDISPLIPFPGKWY